MITYMNVELSAILFHTWLLTKISHGFRILVDSVIGFTWPKYLYLPD
jgi:hypothetical protein